MQHSFPGDVRSSAAVNYTVSTEVSTVLITKAKHTRLLRLMEESAKQMEEKDLEEK